ncbi:MAG: hypothetical protein HY683_02035 [Chloroflexi bacterium]|nr:hypothetical protein [Chloroflexota bacterium]
MGRFTFLCRAAAAVGTGLMLVALTPGIGYGQAGRTVSALGQQPEQVATAGPEAQSAPAPLPGGANGLGPDGPQALRGSGAIAIDGRVRSVRLIVVDQKGRIIGIWSNYPGVSSTADSLLVREGHVTGLQRPLTAGVLSQYQRLAGKVDWTRTGKVYPR